MHRAAASAAVSVFRGRLLTTRGAAGVVARGPCM